MPAAKKGRVRERTSFFRQLVSYIFENKRLLILMSRFVHCLTQTATRLLRQVCKDTGVRYTLCMCIYSINKLLSSKSVTPKLKSN